MKKQPLPDFLVAPPNGSDLIIEGLLHRESLAPRKQPTVPRVWFKDAKRGERVLSVRHGQDLESRIAGLSVL
jgi:hypothetical protein